MNIFREFLITFGWAITGGLSMAIMLPIVIRIFNWINPIDEWQEIKNGNIGVAILLSAVIIATALVIASAIS